MPNYSDKLGAKGLTQTEVDARVVAVAPTANQGGDGPATSFTIAATIADDGVFSYDFGANMPAGTVLVDSSGGQAGIFAIRAHSSGAHCLELAASFITATTGALTGTTGTDGEITISAHTDQKIYIENRIGGVNRFAITINRSNT